MYTNLIFIYFYRQILSCIDSVQLRDEQNIVATTINRLVSKSCM